MDNNVLKVIEALQQRAAKGLLKYGCTTEHANLTPLGWLQHLQEELMDAIIYIEAFKSRTKKYTDCAGCGDIDPCEGQPVQQAQCVGECGCEGTGKFSAEVSDFEYARSHQSCLDPAITRAAGLGAVCDCVQRKV